MACRRTRRRVPVRVFSFAVIAVAAVALSAGCKLTSPGATGDASEGSRRQPPLELDPDSRAGPQPKPQARPESELVVSLVQPLVDDFEDAEVDSKDSRNGRFRSVTVTFTARSRDQLDDIYRALSGHERILYVL